MAKDLLDPRDRRFGVERYGDGATAVERLEQ